MYTLSVFMWNNITYLNFASFISLCVLGDAQFIIIRSYSNEYLCAMIIVHKILQTSSNYY